MVTAEGANTRSTLLETVNLCEPLTFLHLLPTAHTLNALNCILLNFWCWHAHKQRCEGKTSRPRHVYFNTLYQYFKESQGKKVVSTKGQENILKLSEQDIQSAAASQEPPHTHDLPHPVQEFNFTQHTHKQEI